MYDIYIDTRSAAVFQQTLVRLFLRNLYCISLLVVRRKLGIKQERNDVLRVSGMRNYTGVSWFLSRPRSWIQTQWLTWDISVLPSMLWFFFLPLLLLFIHMHLFWTWLISGKEFSVSAIWNNCWETDLWFFKMILKWTHTMITTAPILGMGHLGWGKQL